MTLYLGYVLISVGKGLNLVSLHTDANTKTYIKDRPINRALFASLSVIVSSDKLRNANKQFKYVMQCRQRGSREEVKTKMEGGK